MKNTWLCHKKRNSFCIYNSFLCFLYARNKGFIDRKKSYVVERKKCFLYTILANTLTANSDTVKLFVRFVSSEYQSQQAIFAPLLITRVY